MILFQALQPLRLRRAFELRRGPLRQRHEVLRMPRAPLLTLSGFPQALPCINPRGFQQDVARDPSSPLDPHEGLFYELDEEIENVRILDFGFWILDWVRQRRPTVRSL